MPEKCFDLIAALSVSQDATNTIDEIPLNFDARTRSRGQGVSRAGVEVAWFLEQGEFPRHGDMLLSETGTTYRMVSAEEPVSYVSAKDSFDLMRIAYHLGNRHVPLDVRADSLRFQPDHVLDDMVALLGGTVTRKNAAFEPEDGAYHEHSGPQSHQQDHSHAGDRSHSHDHQHNHQHDNEHTHSRSR